jgi:hypothetical protein
VAKKEAALVGDMVRADDSLVAPITGRTIRSLGGRRPTGEAGLFFLSREAQPSLSLESLSGAVVFTQRFEARDTRLLDATGDPLLVGDDSERGTVHALSAKDGTRRWMRPFEERVEAAHVFEGTVVLRTQTRLVGVEADSGKLIFETALPKNEVVRESLKTSVGLLVVSAKRLTIYEVKRGRAARVLPLEKATTQLALADPFLLALLEGGEVVAFDLAKGRRGGTLETKAPRQLFAAGDFFGFVEADGGAFALFQAAKLLGP